jgi:hypothetical protein
MICRYFAVLLSMLWVLLCLIRLTNTQFDVDLSELHLDSVYPDLMHFRRRQTVCAPISLAQQLWRIKLVADITEIAPEPSAGHAHSLLDPYRLSFIAQSPVIAADSEMTIHKFLQAEATASRLTTYLVESAKPFYSYRAKVGAARNNIYYFDHATFVALVRNSASCPRSTTSICSMNQ